MSMLPPTRRCFVGWLAILGSTLVGPLPFLRGAEPHPLAQAHSHNDYHRNRPLLDALDNGFCNVEADVFLVDNQLLVGHSVDELQRDRTLERLYLEPLRDRVRAHQGKVFSTGPEFVLLIDIKSEGETTFAAIHATLARYAEILTWFDGKDLHPGAVRVIVSGNRPQPAIERARPSYAGMDGRITDLSTGASQVMPATLMPMISDNFGSLLTWRGKGPMPDAERVQLVAWVRQAHEAKRRIRFWNTPEQESVWRELQAAGVDLINTDDLPRLRRFLLAPAPPSP